MAVDQKAKPIPIDLVLELPPGLLDGPRFVLAWAWPLPEHHLGSVGIRALPRTAKGRTWKQWCQTTTYDLAAGYVFYSDAAAYGRIQGREDGSAVEAMTARAVVVPDGADPGKVDFDEYQLAPDGTWHKLGSRSVEFGRFLALLKTGKATGEAPAQPAPAHTELPPAPSQ